VESSEKPTGRGQYMIQAWQEAKKAGGLSYSPAQIAAILDERSDEEVLTREEVKTRISAYFQNCITLSQDEYTGTLDYIWKRNPTKSGLALALSVSPQTLIDYVKGKDRHGNTYTTNNKSKEKTKQKIATDDFDLLRKAYTLIEDFYESKLGENRNNAGVIFWLNNKENTRWSNEQEFKFGTIETKKDDRERTPEEIMTTYGGNALENNEFPELPEFPEPPED